jgi:hypothetical protein
LHRHLRLTVFGLTLNGHDHRVRLALHGRFLDVFFSSATVWLISSPFPGRGDRTGTVSTCEVLRVFIE